MAESFWETEVYAQGRQINRWPFDGVISAVKRHVDRTTSPRVLEVGCGTGNNLWFLAEEGFHVCGVDVSPTAVRCAKEYLRSRGLDCEVLVSDLTHIPYDANAFDVTIDRGCLSCLSASHIPGTVRELYRVLRPGGVHFSFTLHGESHPARALGEEIEPGTFGRFRDCKLSSSGHITFFTAARIHALFERYETREVRRTCRFDGDRIEHEEYSLEAHK